MNEDLTSIASDIVERARALGATEADCYVSSGIESSVTVRKGELERLHENVWEIFNEAKAEKLDELLSRRTD